MPDINPTKVAAAALQVGDLGCRLSLRFYTYAKIVHMGKKEIVFISRDVAATSAVLLQLGHEFERLESAQHCSKEAIEHSEALIEQCELCFAEADAALDGKWLQSTTPAALGPSAAWNLIDGIRRADWPSTELHIELLRATLDELKSSLILILSAIVFTRQVRDQDEVTSLRGQKSILSLHFDEKSVHAQVFDQAVTWLKGQVALQGAPGTNVEVNAVGQSANWPEHDHCIQGDLSQREADHLEQTAVQEWDDLSDRNLAGVAGTQETNATATEAFSIRRQNGAEVEKQRARSRSCSLSRTRARARSTSEESIIYIQKQHDSKADAEVFELFKDELFGHIRLVQRLLAETASTDYNLSHRCRADLEDTIIAAYWDFQRRYRFLSADYKAGEFKEKLKAENDGEELMKFYSRLLHIGEVLRDHSECSRGSLPDNNFLHNLRPEVSRPPPNQNLNLSKSTWIRIHRQYILPETLEHFQLPWIVEEKSPTYFLIKKYISHDLQSVIFRHTASILQARAQTSHMDLIEDSIAIAVTAAVEKTVAILGILRSAVVLQSEVQPQVSSLVALAVAFKNWDFEGRNSIGLWNSVLQKMEGSTALSQTQIQSLVFDMERAQREFRTFQEFAPVTMRTEEEPGAERMNEMGEPIRKTMPAGGNSSTQNMVGGQLLGTGARSKAKIPGYTDEQVESILREREIAKSRRSFRDVDEMLLRYSSLTREDLAEVNDKIKIRGQNN